MYVSLCIYIYVTYIYVNVISWCSHAQSHYPLIKHSIQRAQPVLLPVLSCSEDPKLLFCDLVVGINKSLVKIMDTNVSY